ncbi:MAG: hypothetical protein P8N02_09085, partial [Actinomycetota bacterium]|nr:hypothetical protein [Actinomycetota bacterium]
MTPDQPKMDRSKTDQPKAIWRWIVALIALALLAASCSDDEPDAATPSSGDGADTTESASDEVIDRCAANEAAGTITYLSSFDFAAAASILDVIVAEAEGYFEELCLDVEILPSFAPGNGALVASGSGQISSAGSFGELVNTNVQGEADLVAIAQYGKTAIE